MWTARVRYLLRLIGHRIRLATAFFSFLASFFRSGDQLVSIWPAPEPELGSKVAIFVHFDAAGAARPHVLRYVAALQTEGYDVVFVTNSEFLRPDAMAALQELCAAIIVRRNVGYDFGAMREGLLRLRMPRRNTEQLLIVNDSVYGPLAPMGEMLERIDFDIADIWGATESWQTKYHLQSFFLAVGQTAMQSKAWHDFWARVRPVNAKEWVISRYEVGLTQSLLKAGIKARALWQYQDLVRQVDPTLLSEGGDEGMVSRDPIIFMRRGAARRIRDAAVTRLPLNPTSDLWRQLLHAGFPFIKRELLRDNPTNISDVTDWREVVTEMLGGDPTLIDRDLQRILKNTAP